MEEKIMAILNEICGAEDGELTPDLELFEAGLIDSFAVVQLLVLLEERCGIIWDIEVLARDEISTPKKIIKKAERTL